MSVAAAATVPGPMMKRTAGHSRAIESSPAGFNARRNLEVHFVRPAPVVPTPAHAAVVVGQPPLNGSLLAVGERPALPHRVFERVQIDGGTRAVVGPDTTVSDLALRVPPVITLALVDWLYVPVKPAGQLPQKPPRSALPESDVRVRPAYLPEPRTAYVAGDVAVLTDWHGPRQSRRRRWIPNLFQAVAVCTTWMLPSLGSRSLPWGIWSASSGREYTTHWRPTRAPRGATSSPEREASTWCRQRPPGG